MRVFAPALALMLEDPSKRCGMRLAAPPRRLSHIAATPVHHHDLRPDQHICGARHQYVARRLAGGQPIFRALLLLPLLGRLSSFRLAVVPRPPAHGHERNPSSPRSRPQAGPEVRLPRWPGVVPRGGLQRPGIRAGPPVHKPSPPPPRPAKANIQGDVLIPGEPGWGMQRRRSSGSREITFFTRRPCVVVRNHHRRPARHGVRPHALPFSPHTHSRACVITCNAFPGLHLYRGCGIGRAPRDRAFLDRCPRHPRGEQGLSMRRGVEGMLHTGPCSSITRHSGSGSRYKGS